jgi:hypothetical protein
VSMPGDRSAAVRRPARRGLPRSRWKNAAVGRRLICTTSSRSTSCLAGCFARLDTPIKQNLIWPLAGPPDVPDEPDSQSKMEQRNCRRRAQLRLSGL